MMVKYEGGKRKVKNETACGRNGERANFRNYDATQTQVKRRNYLNTKNAKVAKIDF